MEQVGVWQELKVSKVVEKHFFNFRHLGHFKPGCLPDFAIQAGGYTALR